MTIIIVKALMVTIKYKYSNLTLDIGDFENLVDSLSKQSYSPFLLEMTKLTHEKLDIDFEINQYLDFFNKTNRKQFREDNYCEVFSKNGDVFVIIYQKYLYDHEAMFQHNFNLILLSKNSHDPDKMLNLFMNTIDSIIYNSGNSFFVDDIEYPEAIGWQSPNTKAFSNFEEIEKLRGDFLLPSYSDEELIASRLISKREIRTLLIQIMRSESILPRNLENKLRKKLGTDYECILKDSKSTNLIVSNYIIKCRTSNASLCKLESKSLLEDTSIQNLICATCGKIYKEELVEEMITSTELSNKLMKSSHWMTIYVTDQLLNAGIEKKNILWNILDRSDEIDIALDLKGELILMELKDKKFDKGNADALNSRRQKFGASKTVIITTESVSKEVKDFFENLKNKVERIEFFDYIDSLSNEADAREPIYVEGLDKLEDAASKIVTFGISIEIDQILNEIQNISGLDFSKLLYKYLDN